VPVSDTADLPILPSILEIGPSFQINAQANANLDVELDMNVGINYNINAQLVFPPRSGLSSGGAFSVNDTGMSLFHFLRNNAEINFL